VRVLKIVPEAKGTYLTVDTHMHEPAGRACESVVDTEGKETVTGGAAARTAVQQGGRAAGRRAQVVWDR
jgi:hypothetical protein